MNPFIITQNPSFDPIFDRHLFEKSRNKFNSRFYQIIYPTKPMTKKEIEKAFADQRNEKRRP